jgi:hypothetical protein
MGKVVQPLQSVNCHDSRAHGHERHGPFCGVWFVECWVWIVLGYRGETCELFLVLATAV